MIWCRITWKSHVLTTRKIVRSQREQEIASTQTQTSPFLYQFPAIQSFTHHVRELMAGFVGHAVWHPVGRVTGRRVVLDLTSNILAVRR